MALVNKPDESIFASSAKQGEVDNFPDLLRGWGITFEQTQGIPPMEWFNFLFKRLDEKHTYLMQRGLPEWSATQDYTKGSCVQFDGVSYRALKNSKNNIPNESNSQYWVRWGFALSEIAIATLTQYGLTQLYTGYNSQREDLALTPKTAFLLKQLIDSNTRALGNVIPNSKKSSAVNSNSADTVATSAAVKTAYDKGVEAKNAADNAQNSANDGINRANNAQRSADDGINRANNAQQSADSANRNADSRVAKSGDTMTGNLTVPNLIVNDPANNNNFVQIGDDTKLIDVDMGHTVGLQTTDNANDAYIAYGATKKRFGFDGANFSSESGLGAQWFGSQKRGEGAFAYQWQTEAPYHVHAGNANGSNTYFPYLKGKVTNGDGWGSAFSFGYTTPGARNQFGVGVIHLIEDNGNEKHWWFGHDGKLSGDDFECQGKRLSKSHQTDYAYVETTAAIWGGLKINRNGDHMLIESNERGGFNFIRRNNDGRNVYALIAPTKNGTLATLEDLPIERLIWQGSTDNQITVNAQVSKGVLFVLMDTPHGANANRPIWFSSPIEQCHDTRIGEYDTGGTAGDYNYVTLALLHRNGNNITITPQSDGRKPRIKKVVVFG